MRSSEPASLKLDSRIGMAKTFSESLKALRSVGQNIPKVQAKQVSTNQPKKQVLKAELQDAIHHIEPTINMRTAIPGEY